MVGYAPKPVTLEYVDEASYQGLKPQPLLVVGDNSGQVQGIQSLSVGAMMELNTTGFHSEQSPFLRVKDSGTIRVLLNQPTSGSLDLYGHRYGRAVTVYVRLEQTGSGLDWDIEDLGDNFFLGTPEIHTETLVPVYSAAGDAVQANLRVAIDPDNGVSFTLIGTANAVGLYADFSFSFVTPAPWPDSVPYDAPPGITTLDYTSPAPELEPVWVEWPDDPVRAGYDVTWRMDINPTPTAPVLIHIQIESQEEYVTEMSFESGNRWVYRQNTYLDWPYMETGDNVDVYITTSFGGFDFQSSVKSFHLI